MRWRAGPGSGRIPPTKNYHNVYISIIDTPLHVPTVHAPPPRRGAGCRPAPGRRLPRGPRDRRRPGRARGAGQPDLLHRGAPAVQLPGERDPEGLRRGPPRGSQREGGPARDPRRGPGRTLERGLPGGPHRERHGPLRHGPVAGAGAVLQVGRPDLHGPERPLRETRQRDRDPEPRRPRGLPDRGGDRRRRGPAGARRRGEREPDRLREQRLGDPRRARERRDRPLELHRVRRQVLRRAGDRGLQQPQGRLHLRRLRRLLRVQPEHLRRDRDLLPAMPSTGSSRSGTRRTSARTTGSSGRTSRPSACRSSST